MGSTVQVLYKNEKFYYAIALAMFDSAATSVCSIYAYSIILSYYPANSLIYYIVFQTIFTALLRFIGLRLLSKNYKKSALLQYLIFVFFFILSIVLMHYKAYPIPFIVAVVSSGITSLATIICWSMLSLAFGLREYKVVAKYCNQASYISSIISNLTVPIFVLFFSNSSLLVFVTGMLALCGFSIYKLPVYREEKKASRNKKIKPKPIKYRLYYYMMCLSVLITTITGTGQYIMRLESASYFTQEQLSSFFGYFFGIANFLGLLISFSSGQVLKRFGLQGLLYSIPLIAIINSLVVTLYPNFWGIVALGSIRSIFGYSYGAYSTEISLNILPANIRFITKAKIKSTANIISMILLLIFTFGKTNAYYITPWLLPLSILALFFAYKVKQYYKITLEQESAFKRFNILDEITPATKPILKEIALKSIKSKDTHLVFYGMDLVNKLYIDEALPLVIYNLLEHKNHFVRFEIINLIHSKKMPKALTYFIKRLPKERNEEIQRKLIEEIAYLDLNSALKLCERKHNALFNPVFKHLALLLNGSSQKKALHYFAKLSQDSKPILRKILVSLMGTYKIKPLYTHLKELMLDEDAGVREEALRTVALVEEHSLIPDLIDSLLSNKNNISSQLAILSFGKSSIDYLIPKAYEIRQSKKIIKMISKIYDKAAEDALIRIAEKGTMYHRSIVAQYANKRACKLTITKKFKKKATMLMEEEISMIINLQNKMKETKLKAVQVEIKKRIIDAKILFIQWLAISTSAKNISRLISSLTQNKNEQIFDKAIELLELYVPDIKIKAFISFLFENKELEFIDPLPKPYSDHVLEQIMKNSQQQSPLLSTVFELRSVRLFHHLPAEILLALAEEVEYLHYASKEVIFKKNDLSNGLYCISQGKVNIISDDKIVTSIGPHGFFGELALLDDEPRVATAVAQSPCTLLFIEKDVFNRIADDVPDILRTLIKIILEYLRSNIKERT